MKFLVTGGAGFIGATFIHRLLEVHSDRADVICLDKLGYAGDLERLEDLKDNQRFKFIEGDITDLRR